MPLWHKIDFKAVTWLKIRLTFFDKHEILHLYNELQTSLYSLLLISLCKWIWGYILSCKLTVIVFCLLKQPTESNTYADIDAAYKCLKEQYGVKDDQLILYGQSVGSGPTLDLASRVPDLRGVVLHSPILSGMRVLYPVKRTYWFDIYKV